MWNRTEHSKLPSASRKKRSQSGQSLIEVAFLLPILVVLSLGLIDMGQFAYQGILVGDAAHAGALYGAQGAVFSVDNTGITDAADNDYQNNGQNVAGLAVASSTACGCDNGGVVTSAACSTAINPNAGTCAAGHWVIAVSVTASATYPIMFKIPAVPTTITISRTSTLRVSQN